MFLNSQECKDYMNNKGIFLISDRGYRCLAVKTGQKDFRLLSEKETPNLLAILKNHIWEVDPVGYITIIRPKIRDDFKSREQEIKLHKKIMAELKKSSGKFLKRKKAVILNDGDRHYVYDIENQTSDLIGDGLFSKEDVFKYNHSQVNNAVRDNFINHHQQDYAEFKNKWKSIKIEKS